MNNLISTGTKQKCILLPSKGVIGRMGSFGAFFINAVGSSQKYLCIFSLSRKYKTADMQCSVHYFSVLQFWPPPDKYIWSAKWFNMWQLTFSSRYALPNASIAFIIKFEHARFKISTCSEKTHLILVNATICRRLSNAKRNAIASGDFLSSSVIDWEEDRRMPA